jgi:hypothetical protein
MSKTALITSILALYEKHSWTLRRALLTEKTRGEIDSLRELFGGVDVYEFEKDAAWFSRPSGADGEAWEIRLLSENAFALIDVFGPDQDEDVRADIRSGMEERLRGSTQY